MKSRTLVTFLLAVLSLGLPLCASAHILLTDGTVGAILHIDPEDDPIAGQAATFYFDLKLKSGSFDAALCECSVSFSKKGDPAAPIPYASQMSYTFPEKGIYEIVLAGTPKLGASFPPFRLTDDLRVDREAAGGSEAGQASSPHYLHFIGFGIALLVALFLLIRDKRKRRGYNGSV